MVWYAPISGTTAVNSTANGDSLFIGPTVTLSVTGSRAAYFEGAGDVADIYGTVVSTSLTAIRFGADPAGKGHTIDVHAGAFIRGYGDSGFFAAGYGTQFTNGGNIFGSNAGVAFSASDPSSTSTLTNSGSISATQRGVYQLNFGNLNIINSGVIQGQYAFDSPTTGVIAITNTGTMAGTVNLGSGSDVYNGASGRLSGKLFAAGGNDKIMGGIDNDWFDGGLGDDVLYGGVGTDTVFGGAGNDKLYGDAGNDSLDGGGDNDTLYGGAGNDLLTGGVGKDIFVFNTALNKTTNVDKIIDFSHADDTIWLSKGIFKGAGTGALQSKFFYKGTKAHDVDDRIIYDKATGALYYDPDGTGSRAQIKFATLTNKPANLAYNDFLLV
ncbi:calcium-binding protein [Microvirga terricola]|uniref:Calcium-binding protein n=1 Tax=Microvirga terricola TaxID=2719797 RepID=A0ABX0VGF1_9HYPH|nr:calcium-binding protein [Microvirga terricola]NIX77127.1 calcium-binding protein [Microvirga terricola]